jgi:hypothetical protein
MMGMTVLNHYHDGHPDLAALDYAECDIRAASDSNASLVRVTIDRRIYRQIS